MPAGEAFTAGERREIDRALGTARELSGLEFSVYVGPTEGDPRRYAERLHGALDDPDRAVLVLVDPVARRLEIVTGAVSGRLLPNPDCGLVALTMQSTFAAGDLVRGITVGVYQLADRARRPAALHTEQR